MGIEAEDRLVILFAGSIRKHPPAALMQKHAVFIGCIVGEATDGALSLGGFPTVLIQLAGLIEGSRKFIAALRVSFRKPGSPGHLEVDLLESHDALRRLCDGKTRASPGGCP